MVLTSQGGWKEGREAKVEKTRRTEVSKVVRKGLQLEREVKLAHFNWSRT